MLQKNPLFAFICGTPIVYCNFKKKQANFTSFFFLYRFAPVFSLHLLFYALNKTLNIGAMAMNPYQTKGGTKKYKRDVLVEKDGKER